MEIRNNPEALKSLLGVGAASSSSSTAGAQPPVSNPQQPSLGGDKATVSAAGAQAAASSDVRLDKVQAVQSALAAGTYSVSPHAVAGKVVDALLAQGSAGPK